MACYVASEAFLCWKNGSAPDDEKAIAFFESVFGDKYDYEFWGCNSAGEYCFEVYTDDNGSTFFYVNWECDKIVISTGDRGAVEVYPNDVEGILADLNLV